MGKVYPVGKISAKLPGQMKRRRKPNHVHTNSLIERGYRIVVGIDEVGRGSLAGPVTAAAVILPTDIKIRGANDSKLLDPYAREKLVKKIKAQAMAIGVGWASHTEIDQYGLTWAVRASGLRALADMGSKYDAVILDGKHNYLKGHCYAEAVVKGDQRCLNVACASIVAKVARDNYMYRMHEIYPKFGWLTNVGYATKSHLEAMKRELSPLHRRLFTPVARLNQTQFAEFYEQIGAIE